MKDLILERQIELIRELLNFLRASDLQTRLLLTDIKKELQEIKSVINNGDKTNIDRLDKTL